MVRRCGTAAEQVAAGNYQQPIGELSADLLLAFIPAAFKKLQINPTTLLNPIEQKAVEYGLQKGMPINLATGTGNPMYGGLQAAIEKLPFAGTRAQKSKLVMNEALQTESKDLATRTTAVPGSVSAPGYSAQGSAFTTAPGVTPAQDLYEAGGRLHSTVKNKLEKQVIPQARAAYDALEQISNQPKNVKTVQTGMQPGFAPNGRPTMTPVYEQIAGPVDIRLVKAKLQPEYDELIQTIPLAQRELSPGLTAMKNVIESPDVIPLAKALKDYSAILRTTKRDHPDVFNASERIGIMVGQPYRETLNSAVARMDPTALELLNKGRALTVDKWRLTELVDDLGKEPGKIADAIIKEGDKSFAGL